MTSLASERVAVLAVIDPDAYVAAAVTSDWADAAAFNRLMAILLCGTMGSSGTLIMKLQQATSSAGAGNKDITGKVITILTDAGSDSDKQAIINVRADELDIANDFTHVAMVVTTATATGDSGAILLGIDARVEPASDNDLASVDEIIA